MQKVLEGAREVVAFTGAGISASSGIPTFRDAQTGLWAKYDPQELATPQAFQKQPRTVLLWYQWRRSLIEKAQPNPGHKALVTLEKQAQGRNQRFTLITQNIDHLHSLAGSKNIIELHGNIFRYKCGGCGRPSDSKNPDIDEEGPLPRCPACGGIFRPDVVWFGEALPESKLQRAFSLSSTCDVFFSIGTSALVQPAASLPLIAVENDATLVEINPQRTPLTPKADFVFNSSAAEVLPTFIER